MKLCRAEISEFQSIRSTNPFDIGEITCLVGKNEAGKTAILQALYRLNPIIPENDEFDVTDDYPRSDVEDYQQEVDAGKREPAIVTKAVFMLLPEELKDIETEFGSGILKNPELILSKGYDNSLYVELTIDEKKAIHAIIEETQIPTELEKEFLTSTSLDALQKLVDAHTDPDVSEHIQRLKASIEKIRSAEGLTLYIYTKYLEKKVPKFMYFDEYFLMTGQDNIEALKKRVEQDNLEKSDYPLLGLIELARLDLEELLNPERTESLVNKLEGASNHLTKKVLKYWSQNKHLRMEFDVRPGRSGDPDGMTTGTNIWGRIHDTKRQVSTRLGTRSRGFLWFFSFLAWFDQQQKKNEPLILLLDEPGLFLHGRAQADLLDYIEKELKGSHQVLYTTHSPFMVDATKFERVLIVQDKSTDSEDEIPKEQDGTKVISEVLDATEDSLFPLQGALGYDIYQSLFVGPNSLIVEGVSDLLYLQAMSGVLESLGREKLSEQWTITPVGGSDKVPTFVALLGAQHGLKIATLIDIQKKDHQTVENLYKKKLLKKQNVLTFADFTGFSEADIEDMFGVDFYLELVNQEYSADLKSPVTLKMLTSKSPRIIQRLEECFRKNPLISGNAFSHFRPARYFAENITKLTKDIPSEAIDRFESAFKMLNNLL